MTLLKHCYIYMPGSSLMYKKRHNNLSRLFVYPFSSSLQSTVSMFIFDSPGLSTRKNIESRSIHFLSLTAFVCVYLLYLFQLFANPPTSYLPGGPSGCFNTGILIYLILTSRLFMIIIYVPGQCRSWQTTSILEDIVSFFLSYKTFLCKSKTAI